MNKKIITPLLILMMLFLSSCSIAASRVAMLNLDNDQEQADKRLEKIIKSIKNEDKDALEDMFSKQALKEANDLDGCIDSLFDNFQGEVISWESDGPIVSESNSHGHKTKEAKSFYKVETDKQKYLFFLLEYTEDTDHPDNVGLYALRVIKAEDEETQFGYWQDMKIAGIYLSL